MSNGLTPKRQLVLAVRARLLLEWHPHAHGGSRCALQDRNGPNRAKPMPATATAMVKAIWRSYFQIQGGAADSEAVADGDAPLAKAVEEVHLPPTAAG